jgi:hypothetical protein
MPACVRVQPWPRSLKSVFISCGNVSAVRRDRNNRSENFRILTCAGECGAFLFGPCKG